MNKVKVLSLLASGLLISNLLLVGFVIFKKPQHPKHEGPKHLIIEKLDFNENQIKAYDTLIGWHRKEIRSAEQEIMGLKTKLYSILSKDSSELNKDSLIFAIGQKQQKIESIHYKHFQDIKKLCNPNQKQAFNELSMELSSLFSKPLPREKRR